MQKEGPIVTFSHVVKKFVQRGSPEKKIPAQAVSEKKFVQAENSPPPPPPITFLMVRPLHHRQAEKSISISQRMISELTCYQKSLLNLL